MKLQVELQNIRELLLPTRALLLLMSIGFIDLIITAVLHANGQIVELNPVMRPLIEHSEWLFVAVKSTTLLVAWAVMAWYAKKNLDFVRKACLLGAGVYLIVWSSWFLISA